MGFFRTGVALLLALGAIYETERPSGSILSSLYVGTVLLFLELTVPVLRDPSVFPEALRSGGFGNFFMYAYPLFVAFFLPFAAVWLAYGRLVSRRIVRQSLLVCAVAYSASLFVATVALAPAIPSKGLYLSFGFFLESALLFLVAIRFRSMRIDPAPRSE